jgi:hypothetical protein
MLRKQIENDDENDWEQFRNTLPFEGKKHTNPPELSDCLLRIPLLSL